MNRYKLKLRTLILSCSAIACLLLAPLATHAQSLERGAIHGTVMDKTHAVVPGTKVTLTNPSTGIRRELTAGSSGDYDFEAVPPGEYTIVTESTGFAVA